MIKRLIFVLMAIFFANPAWCYELADHVTPFQLENGMRWLLVKRTQAPVFSGVVMVRVGGMDEEKGKTGIAHMFEHMAFKGSSRIGTRDYQKEKGILDKIEQLGEVLTREEQRQRPDLSLVGEIAKQLATLEKEADGYRAKSEVWEVLVRNGAADLNAYTNKDITAYHASMPITKLELWARVIADMIFDPVYREFYTERKVIAEERRSGVENNPDGLMSEKILSSAYAQGPYSWSTIGLEKDILGLTISDARSFHNSYYIPANMVGVLVGDINLRKAKKILRRTFGIYPAGTLPETHKDPGRQKKQIVTRFSYRAEPSLAVAYHKPTLPDPAEYTFDVINALLCEGRSSRLQKQLIYEKKMVENIYCTVGYPGSRLPNLFLIWAEPIKPHSPDAVLKEIQGEIAKLRGELVDENELERVKKIVTASMVFAVEDNMALAEGLAEFEAAFGGWRIFADYPKKVAKVSASDVMENARKFLVEANRVVVERTKVINQK